MAANGISNLSTKQAKQVAKLNLAQYKRQGYTLNADGSVASGPDTTKNFYRINNTYTITELPESYSGNTAVNNGNGANLIQGRPWKQLIVTSGLQLFLDAASQLSYPGTGTTWYDLSGNHNDLTMQNASNINYTNINGGYFTLTSNGYFDRATTTGVPTGSSPYCLSVWINTHPNWGNLGFVGIGNDFTTDHVNEFRGDSLANLKNYWWSNDFTHSFNVSGTDPNNTYWLNLVAQWDGTTRSLWANGVQQGTQASSGLNVDNSYVQVGRTKTNEYLDGQIGQVLIYNRALTSTEIQQNFNVIKTRYGF